MHSTQRLEADLISAEPGAVNCVVSELVTGGSWPGEIEGAQLCPRPQHRSPGQSSVVKCSAGEAASCPQAILLRWQPGTRVPGACCSQKDGLSLAHISLGSQSRSSHSAKRPICPVAPTTGAQLLQPPNAEHRRPRPRALEAMACEMCLVGKEGDLAFVMSFWPAASGLKGF